MILNRIGAKCFYNGITYTIGDRILANEESAYKGLYGTILEIRDGDDKETENDTPDIYCRFMPPILPKDIKDLEDTFSKLYGQPKSLADITLDMVIMAPEMIQILTPSDLNPLPMYIVREEWVYDGDGSEDITVVADIQLARYKFLSLINQELLDGRCTEWPKEKRVEEIRQDHYSCWLADDYCANHYEVSIETISVSINHELAEAIGKQYIASQLRKHFAKQIESWEEIADLTPAQLAMLIGSDDVPDRIRKQLEGNGDLIESYWESVSEAAFELVQRFIKNQIRKETSSRENQQFTNCPIKGGRSWRLSPHTHYTDKLGILPLVVSLFCARSHIFCSF